MTSRREFLTALAGYAIATQPLVRAIEAQTGLPIDELRKALGPRDGLIVTRDQPISSELSRSYNLRTTLKPEVRVLCQSAKGVATTVQWARSNRVSFSTRGAGHCYEDFSQNLTLVIDTRKMTDHSWDSDGLISVGAGMTLGSLYELADAKHRAFPGGSCPTVGVAGHSMGGGYGRLSRPMGLACDNVRSFEMIDANGKTITASAASNADLFWALRGGGGGSFGIVTKFTFETSPIGMVSVCSATWTLPVVEAVKVFHAWQAWAPKAPSSITTTMRVAKPKTGPILLHLSGQSTASAAELRREIAGWAPRGSAISTETMSFMKSVDRFAGGRAGFVPEPVYIKNRSDYVKKPMTEEGVRTMINELIKLSPGAISGLCDAYGGKIADVAADATAFAHRDALYSIQWYCGWATSSQTDSRLEMSRKFHKAMRPYVSGSAYVNYPDAELPDYAHAYWGDNLPRLMRIKSKYDPENLFRHRQSVPLA